MTLETTLITNHTNNNDSRYTNRFGYNRVISVFWVVLLSILLCHSSITLVLSEGTTTEDEYDEYGVVDPEILREVRAFCQAERNAASSCLLFQPRSVQGCNSCVSNSETRALSRLANEINGGGLRSCNVYNNNLCSAVNDCNCGSCADEYVALHRCNVRALSGGSCSSFPCTLTAPACTFFQIIFGACGDECSFFGQLLGLCTPTGGGTGILPPTPIGVPPRPGPSPAPIPTLAQNDPTVVQPTSVPTVVCPDERDTVNTCLEEKAVFTCGECIAATYEAFVELGTYNCNDFKTNVCPAIESDCTSCDPCRDVIDDLYQCVVQFESVCTTDETDVCPVAVSNPDRGICGLFIISFFCAIADFIGNLFGI